MHPSVSDAADREIQRRLISVCLLAPFFLTAGLIQVFAAELSAGIVLAGASITFGIFWAAALFIGTIGGERVAATVAGGGAFAVISLTVAAAGGMASPLAVMALVPALEAWWVYRSGRAALGGALLALGTLLAAHLFHGEWATGEPAHAAHWLLPLAYLMTVGLRYAAALADAAAPPVGERPTVDALLSGAAVFHVDAGGDVVEVGGDPEAIFGVQHTLLLSTGLFDRVHVTDRVHCLCALADARDGRSAVLEMRVKVRTDGAEHFKTVSAQFARLGDGKVMVVLREQQELLRLRDALAEARDALDKTEITKGRFLAAVSHELRTPLNAIIGFSDMLLHQVGCQSLDQKQQEYVGLIRDSGGHLLDVVNSILDVSKIESGAYPIHAEPFPFVEAVAMSHSMMKLLAMQKSIIITERLPANLGELHADRRAIHQILINLLSNAVKFTPAGGAIEIGAKRLGTRLHFWVSDTGIGIADEDMERLGDPFMQVQNDYTRQYEGTGLGLSVVKGLVTLHDGTLSVESALGEGTKVSISLPLFGPKRRAKVTDPQIAQTTTNNGEIDAPIRQAS